MKKKSDSLHNNHYCYIRKFSKLYDQRSKVALIFFHLYHSITFFFNLQAIHFATYFFYNSI
jgi:hypothetical protein